MFKQDRVQLLWMKTIRASYVLVFASSKEMRDSEIKMKATDFENISNSHLWVPVHWAKTPFSAISPKWHHLKITTRTPSLCNQYFLCQKLANAVYNIQKDLCFKEGSPMLALYLSPWARWQSWICPCALLSVTTSIPDFWATAESAPTASPHSSSVPIQRLLIQFPPSVSMSDTSLSFVSSANCWGCPQSLLLCHYWRY